MTKLRISSEEPVENKNELKTVEENNEFLNLPALTQRNEFTKTKTQLSKSFTSHDVISKANQKNKSSLDMPTEIKNVRFDQNNATPRRTQAINIDISKSGTSVNHLHEVSSFETETSDFSTNKSSGN